MKRGTAASASMDWKAAPTASPGFERVYETMSTSTVKAQSGIESVESVGELPRGVGRLGTDGEGAVHYFYGMPHWKVWVFVNDDLVHEQAIEPGQVEEWIEFIDKEKGWKTNFYGQSLVEMFEEAVTIKEESGDE